MGSLYVYYGLNTLEIDTKMLGENLDLGICAAVNEAALWYLTSLDISYMLLVRLTLPYHVKMVLYWLVHADN